MSVHVYSLLGQTEWERKKSLKGDKNEAASWDYPQEHLVGIRDEKCLLFVKFEKTPPFLCCLLDPLKTDTAGSGVLKFVDRFQKLTKESCCRQGEGLIIT